MNIIDLVPGSSKWHSWRNEGITATDSSVLLGLSPYKTAYVLYREKLGLQEAVDLWGNPYVRNGVRLEPKARRLMSALFGELILPRCIELAVTPFRASLDGYVESEAKPLEIKVPSPRNYQQVVELGVQSSSYAMHVPQVMTQIMCCQSSSGYLIFYNPDESGDYRLFEVARDEMMILAIDSLGRDFQQRLIKQDPPHLDIERDYFYPSPDIKNEWEDIERRYIADRIKMKFLEAQVEEYKQKLSKHEASFVRMMGEYRLASTPNIGINRHYRSGKLVTRISVHNDSPQTLN